MKKLFLAIVLVLSSAAASAADYGACHGQFANLFSDICWNCSFPIKLFGANIMNDPGADDFDSGNIDPLCTCMYPPNPIPKTGFHVSFWEFARQIDVTRTPYCMVSLGMMMDMGVGSEGMGTSTMEPSNIKGSRTTFRHAHWYINPAMGLMQVMLDSKCLEPKGFDIAYLSEIDPTHIDEELERILNPESFMFGNFVAQAACSADCIAASVGFGLNALYWCSGCQGTVFPMTGFMPNTYGAVQSSSLMTHKVTAKLHRMLTQWSSVGKEAMCTYAPQINMDKRAYKYSMMYPVAQSSPDPNGRCCQPYGRTTILWGAGREIPVTGEDSSYAIFRKRDCCQ